MTQFYTDVHTVGPGLVAVCVVWRYRTCQFLFICTV
jgi:hypothetical protein